MDKTLKIILLVAAGFVAFVVAICIVVGIIVFSTLNKQKQADYFKLGNDQIATVKLVVGERKINSVSTETSNGVTTKVYEYKSGSSADDMKQYEEYLQEREGFVITSLSDEEPFCLVKNSSDEGKILIVNIVDTQFGYVLTIRKGEGQLESKL